MWLKIKPKRLSRSGLVRYREEITEVQARTILYGSRNTPTPTSVLLGLTTPIIRFGSPPQKCALLVLLHGTEVQ